MLGIIQVVKYPDIRILFGQIFIIQIPDIKTGL